MTKSKDEADQKCSKTFKVLKVVTFTFFFVIFSINAANNDVFIEANASKFKSETISKSTFEVGVSTNCNILSNSHEKRYDATLHENIKIKEEGLQKEKKQISGAVVDENSLPIIGANIIELGTSNGTITDINGQFSLTVEDPAIIRISYIGYMDLDISTEGRHTFNITLQESTEEFDEVVVVGYGTQKKISVTGSISQISTDNVLKISTPNIANAISGKMPGIITRQSSGEPGYDAAQVYIRGLVSLTNNSPLILVDGVERDMNLINAQEVETFTVLKDASATAVYGARGANGVILITTKRGEEKKPVVVLRTEFASLQALRLPNYINSEKYALLMNEALTFNGQGARWNNEEIQKYRDGSDPYLYPNSDWTEAVLTNNTWQTINNLSVTGGTELIKYYVNVGYTLQDGLYKEDPNNKYNTNAKISRYNFRSNTDVNLTKNFTLQLGLGGIIQNGNYPGFSSGQIFDALRIISPIAYPILNPDGSLGGAQSYIGWNPYGRVTQSGYSTQDRITLQGSFGLNWNLDFIIKGLSTRVLFSYDRFARNDNNRSKEFGVKRYMGKDPIMGEDIYSPWFREEKPLGYYEWAEGNRAMYLETQLNYAHTFNDIHDIAAMLLYNQREYVNLTAGSSRMNVPYRRQGYAGRLTYALRGRYLTEFNFGYNGSENFPQGKRFGFFPSGSVGWVMSEEEFFNKQVINKLKLRVSHGSVGNDQIGQRFLFLSTINTGGQTYPFGELQQSLPGMDENQIGNPNVSWEEAKKTNFGVDIGILNDRLGLQLDIFNEKRTGILIQRGTVPQVTGIYPWAVSYANLGKVKNRGVDAIVEFRGNSRTSGFYYNLQGNITYATNEVIENDEPRMPYPYLTAKGRRIGQYYALVANGFFKDQEDIDTSPFQTFGTVRPGDVKYKDINGDGVIDSYDKLPVGYARNPEISFGFGGTIGYKNIDLSLFFTGAANTTLNIGGFGMWAFYDGIGANNVLEEYYNNHWTPDNPGAKYPAIDVGNNPNNFQSSTIWMKNANYLRLRNAEIGYTLPKKLFGNYPFVNVRLFVNGMNLYTWDHIKFMDPESNDGTGGYPLQRNINFGMQIDFN
jgi:TonB-linked SusC/RagA family outer membrane protein